MAKALLRETLLAVPQNPLLRDHEGLVQCVSVNDIVAKGMLFGQFVRVAERDAR